jgi:hypothetical protein
MSTIIYGYIGVKTTFYFVQDDREMISERGHWLMVGVQEMSFWGTGGLCSTRGCVNILPLVE